MAGQEEQRQTLLDCELHQPKVKRLGKPLRSRRKPASAGLKTSGCSHWLRSGKGEEFAAEVLPTIYISPNCVGKDETAGLQEKPGDLVDGT